MTDCKCELAGWCETHKRKMSEARFNECKTKPGYFDIFQKDLKKREGIGLGDVVETITTMTGIKTVVEAINGGKCGKCEERKEKLNKIRL